MVGAGTCEDVFDMIQAEKERPTFDINQPTWVRALYFSMAMNNRMLWTDQGVNWLTDSLIELAPINGYVASRLLNTFQQVRNLKPNLQVKVRAALRRIADEVPDGVSPTVHSQAVGYLG